MIEVENEPLKWAGVAIRLCLQIVEGALCKHILSALFRLDSHLPLPFLCYLQSFLGFRQTADVDIILDGAENRKMAEIKTEDGKKEKHYLYYDGETVSGKVMHHTLPC